MFRAFRNYSQLRATLLLCLPLVTAAATAAAQEPAFYSGSKMVRFPQGNDIFHYLGPCGAPAAAPQANLSAAASTPAICWYVNAIRIRKVNGKMETSPAASGKLSLSPEELRFLPSAAGEQDVAFHAPLSKVTFHHTPGKPFAIFAGEDTAYQFVFTEICMACAKNAAPAAPTQDSEFDLLGQAFTNFDAVSRRITDLSATAEAPSAPAIADAAATQNPDGSYEISQTMLARHLIKQVEPLYPVIAKASNTQGSVILHAVISKTGDVGNLKIVSGPMLLQTGAVEAVQLWKYKPFSINGQPVSVASTITVNFTADAPADDDKPKRR